MRYEDAKASNFDFSPARIIPNGYNGSCKKLRKLNHDVNPYHLHIILKVVHENIACDFFYKRFSVQLERLGKLLETGSFLTLIIICMLSMKW